MRMKHSIKGCSMLLGVLPWMASTPTTVAAPSPCQRLFGPAVQNSVCASRSEAVQLARTALFSEVDPTSVIKRDTGLALAGITVQRSAAPFIVPPGAANWPTSVGPAENLFYRYGRVPAPQRVFQPPGPQATFVDVREWLERESRGIQLLQEPASPRSVKKRTGIWFFSADLDHQHMSLEVESDGPKAIVSRMGWDLVRALRATRIPPSLPVQVYVLSPHVDLHVGRPATFWVANNGGFITAHVGIDYAFNLSGAWNRPHTFAPGNTQACGGDSVPAQPYRKSGLWRFAWGDCDELGLVLTPAGTGPRTLTIYSYRVPLNEQGVPNYAREQLEPRQTYVWRGNVRP
jgi:hypothetical protein